MINMLLMMKSENRFKVNKDKGIINLTSGLSQYMLSALITILTAAMFYPFKEIIGYQAVAFGLLIAVSLLALFVGIGPVFVSATLSALIWDFFYLPPPFTLHIEKLEDVLMLAMYFFIAVFGGIMTNRIRRQERITRERESQAAILDESDKLYKSLFNSISHELRIPVATIMGASDTLLSGEFDRETNKHLYVEIGKASERLNRLIENLLNMSRLESGRIAAKPDWHDVRDLANKVLETLKSELVKFKVEVNIPDDMPLVKIDFGLMEQVLHNLVLNATQYSKPDTAIVIKMYFDSPYFILNVLDRGSGFPPKELRNVFNKFYRLEGSISGGTGLGLSIVKGFVEAHNGTVIIENREDGGASVTVSIPTETPDLDKILQ